MLTRYKLGCCVTPLLPDDLHTGHTVESCKSRQAAGVCGVFTGVFTGGPWGFHSTSTHRQCKDNR